MIRRNLKQLFGVNYNESFVYLLHQKDFNRPVKDVSMLDYATICRKLVASILPKHNDRIDQIIEDLEYKHYDNHSIFNLIKVILGIKQYNSEQLVQPIKKSFYEKLPIKQILSQIYNNNNLFMDYKINLLVDTKFIQPLISYLPIVSCTFQKYISLSQQISTNDELSYLETIQLQHIFNKLQNVANLEQLVQQSLVQLRFCNINDLTSQCIQEMVENSIRAFIVQQLSIVIKELSTTQIISNDEIFVLKQRTQSIYDKFSLFEHQLFENVHKSSLFSEIFNTLHNVFHVISISTFSNSNQLKLGLLEIIHSLINIFQFQTVNLDILEKKILNSFNLTDEFRLSQLTQTTKPEPLNQKINNFNTRQRQLQKQLIYKEMLDNCVLIQKDQTLQNQLHLQANLYDRLQNFTFNLDKKLVEKVEIQLGFQCDKETVISLIEDMRAEFFYKVSQNEDDFIRLLQKSAPNLMKIYYDEMSKSGVDIVQEELTKPVELSLEQSMLQSQQFSAVEELANSEVNVEIAQKSVVLDIQRQEQATFHSTLMSVVQTNISSPGLTIPEISQVDFYFNNQILIDYMTIPINKLLQLTSLSVMTYYGKQNLFQELQNILDFYCCQNSLQVADYIEKSELPSYILQQQVIQIPKVNNIQKLPINLQIQPQNPYFTAQCENQINQYILNPIYPILNVIFSRIQGCALKLSQIDTIQQKVKRKNDRRNKFIHSTLWSIRVQLSIIYQRYLLISQENIEIIKTCMEDSLCFIEFLQKIYSQVQIIMQNVNDNIQLNKKIITLNKSISEFLNLDEFDEEGRAIQILKIKNIIGL